MGNSITSSLKNPPPTDSPNKCEAVKRGYGTSIVRKERFIYTWTLKDLKSLRSLVTLKGSNLTSCQITSPPFQAGDSVEKRAQWFLSVAPEDFEGNRYLSLQLVLSKSFRDAHKVQIPVDFSVAISFGQHPNLTPYVQKAMGLVIFERPGQTQHGWSNFLKYTENMNKLLESGQVVIECDMEIWGNRDLDSDAFIPKKKPHLSTFGKNSPNQIIFAEPCSKVMDILHSQYKIGEKTDVNIETSSGVLKAHKVVLRAHSIYFENKFQHDDSNYVKISDCDEKTMRAALEWMYTGVLEENDFDTNSKLLKVADQLKLPLLKNQIFSWMTQKVRKNSLDSKNLADIIILAGKYQLRDVEGEETFQKLKGAFASSSEVREKLTSNSNLNFINLLKNHSDACAAFWF